MFSDFLLDFIQRPFPPQVNSCELVRLQANANSPLQVRYTIVEVLNIEEGGHHFPDSVLLPGQVPLGLQTRPLQCWINGLLNKSEETFWVSRRIAETAHGEKHLEEVAAESVDEEKSSRERREQSPYVR